MNRLIGQAPGAALPPGKTKWQIVLDRLALDLETIPWAYGPWTDGQDPATAAITHANFEVVENALPPGSLPVDPVPDIRANGSDGPLNVSASDTVTLSLSLDAGGLGNTDADWWVVGTTPGVASFDLNSFAFTPGLSTTYRGPLFDFENAPLPDLTDLEPGAHTFYFAVDAAMNGSLDADRLYFDSVVVNVSEPRASSRRDRNFKFKMPTSLIHPPFSARE